MNNTDRILVYLVGFGIGLLLVWMIMARRSEKDVATVDPWLVHNSKAIAEGAEPVPEGLPAAIYKGKIIDFGYLPSEAALEQKIWLLSFEESYPYVRIVEDVASGKYSYMAADQITIKLSKGVDVTELKPMLDELGLRLRMFNRKENIAVIGVMSTQIDAVPATIEVVEGWNQLFESVGPDTIRFQQNKL